MPFEDIVESLLDNLEMNAYIIKHDTIFDYIHAHTISCTVMHAAKDDYV